ncbi:hypothetical protein MPNT_10325 [Candidatus Methylacidithermus pantelleriae]|uniref:Uncharacterized protein n=1 Tax=Candidatus Methylacidithermus pantelleriae TaxID=2744239 RepID=A0A8J2BMD0_9BACT|nr:hypothetical protein MPNT_10325 [Candidatus Methylacidithermus pantelleriae]
MSRVRIPSPAWFVIRCFAAKRGFLPARGLISSATVLQIPFFLFLVENFLGLAVARLLPQAEDMEPHLGTPGKKESRKEAPVGSTAF